MRRSLIWAAMILTILVPESSWAVRAKTSSLCKSQARHGRCLAVAVAGADGQPLPLAQATGYGPSQFRTAYQVVSRGTVRLGVVVAYHNSTLVSDVATFSRQFGLPTLPSCANGLQNGCLEVRNETGGQSPPAADSGWALEESLDVEAAHGQCPGCRIEVVEAAGTDMGNFMIAEDEAVILGARIISNSWGGGEMAKEGGFDFHFNHPGVTFVFSSGDTGYHVLYPAASPSVLAVGGTTLTMGAGGQRQEAAWKGSGSGCSRYEAKPSWQSDRGCATRTVADIAADADPATGAAVYHAGHWYEVGGTSLAAPLVAGMMAASGVADAPATVYRRAATGLASDIVTGKTASCGLYLCTAGAGYDGPTGWGSPIAGQLFR